MPVVKLAQSDLLLNRGPASRRPPRLVRDGAISQLCLLTPEQYRRIYAYLRREQEPNPSNAQK